MAQTDLHFSFEIASNQTSEASEQLFFDVVEFRLTEALNTPFMLEVELISKEPAVDFSKLLDQGATLTIWQGKGFGAKAVRHIHGLVSNFTQGDSGFRRTRYSAVIEPSMARTGLSSDWRIFQQTNVQEIISSVFKGDRINNFEITAQNPHPAREYCVQAGDSNLGFIQRLAAQEGFVYTFKHEASSHQLLMSDVIQTIGAIESESTPVLYNPTPAGDKQQPALRSFIYQENVRTATQTQRDYTFKNPRYNQEHASSGKNLENQAHHYEHYDYPGQYKADEAGKPFTSTRIQALRGDAQIATAIGDDARIQPGFAFELTGHPRGDMNVYWRPIAVTHIGRQHTAGEEEAALAGSSTEYEQTAILVPATTEWKAPIPHNTKIHGAMMAHVTGPSGEEIYVDEHGRVKVQFPWDREHSNDEHSSCWIRVAQNWAGAGWGHMAIPRIGQEVIVSFLDGDESQPIITGRAYDANHPTPYKLPALKTQNTVKSKEHKGSGFNELLIDDTTGELKTQLHSTHAATQLTMGYLTHPRASDGSGEHRGDGFELRSDQWGAIRAGKGLYLSADKRDKAEGNQLDLEEAINQLQNALSLAQSLASSAQTAQAKSADVDDQEQQLAGVYEELKKAGILASSPEGIALVTPKSVQTSAQVNNTLTSGESTDISAGKDIRLAAANNLSLFAVQDELTMIAGQGKVKVQANDNTMDLMANKDVQIISTEDCIHIVAKNGILLTSGGGYIKIADGDIKIHTPGIIEHKGAGFPFMGPTSMDYAAPNLAKVAGNYNLRFQLLDDNQAAHGNRRYTLFHEDGSSRSGITDSRGFTATEYFDNPEKVTVHLDTADSKKALLQTSLVEAGRGSANSDTTPSPCKISSETVARNPKDRARTKIGVGEEVTLTVTPEPATWIAKPANMIKFPDDQGSKSTASVVIKALDKAGSVTITAKTSSSTCSITFTIVTPSTLRMERIEGTPLIHMRGVPNCGWSGRPIVEPRDVNFLNVSIRELNDKFKASGIFKDSNRVYHGQYSANPDNASGWTKLDSFDSSKGSYPLRGRDTIWSGRNTIEGSMNPSPPPLFLEGEVKTRIRWQWTIDTSKKKHHDFPAFEQRAVSDGEGTCVMSKGGHSETSLVNDPTTGM